ncbi:uncharacterized protein LOC8260379 [Ricinus communis]|uniref:Uncharacterized protein n=1 Tax=Ricinus communis TaxID=3988 RepID=B9SLX5_RICCO|nr:uncharacterized protein LOC8260379 [Ricinus communis]EEF35366.1 conserved hypothetical protein [Ricinus communis]|eukprot:XP_002526994.1 uncharacterized protein LOC8260379 [Ricinus communis]
MAIDVCSEISSAGISPRISFSHDLNQATDSVSIQDCNPRLDSCLLDSDFDFCTGSSFVQELSSADELFSNGKILPIEIKKCKKLSVSTKRTDQPKPITTHSLKSSTDTPEKKLLKEFLSMSIDADEKPISTKSFWQFKRSNSLNCDSTTRSKGLIRSLQFLSRSNSTGSAPNPPKLSSVCSKENQKPRLQKQHSVPTRKSPATNFGAFYGYNSGQKHPSLRKCGSYGNGVRISPVLNIPPPYISRGTANLFGLGSLFCNGKVKRKKR